MGGPFKALGSPGERQAAQKRAAMEQEWTAFQWGSFSKFNRLPSSPYELAKLGLGCVLGDLGIRLTGVIICLPCTDLRV